MKRASTSCTKQRCDCQTFSPVLNRATFLRSIDFDLCLAAHNGLLGDVTWLLRAGANPNGGKAVVRSEANQNSVHGSALFLASRNGSTSIVYALVRAGARVNDWGSWTRDDFHCRRYAAAPLIKAAMHGHLDVVRVLCAFGGANVADFGSNKSFSPVLVAAQNGHISIFNYLVTHAGASPFQTPDWPGSAITECSEEAKGPVAAAMCARLSDPAACAWMVKVALVTSFSFSACNLVVARPGDKCGVPPSLMTCALEAFFAAGHQLPPEESGTLPAAVYRALRAAQPCHMCGRIALQPGEGWVTWQPVVDVRFVDGVTQVPLRLCHRHACRQHIAYRHISGAHRASTMRPGNGPSPAPAPAAVGPAPLIFSERKFYPSNTALHDTFSWPPLPPTPPALPPRACIPAFMAVTVDKPDCKPPPPLFELQNTLRSRNCAD